ncbi:epimerase [Fictibacillus macauensis ZFHKF-1]|uniref:Epimerase n=1 Tax=Fictibacillus macauensis ZFHKF-1 TaxID=1196324 RepID=I8UC35_9BACL|nr:aldose 1-epimerase [Fictibacillus macauensis]EIT84358.1 epimerase [Fictibacillus macauensis ZFHKF-1]
MITETTYLEEQAYVLENEHLQVTVVPALGSNVMRIFDRYTKQDILRSPATREEREQRKTVYGTPVLFPPNRMEDATFTYRGVTYALEMNRAKENVHIHGFVQELPWNVQEVQAANTTLTTVLHSKDHASILSQFPHDFSLEMTITLQGQDVIQTLTVKNHGDEPMPCGLGYHTTFHFPKGSKLAIDIEQQWELNERHLPTGTLLPVKEATAFKQGRVLDGVALDDVYVMTQDRKAVITTPHDTTITYSTNERFTQWVLFTASGDEELLAIEPYSWVTNAPNLAQLPATLTGMDEVAGHRNKVYETKITVK